MIFDGQNPKSGVHLFREIKRSLNYLSQSAVSITFTATDLITPSYLEHAKQRGAGN